MIEILGGRLDLALKELGVNATKTYGGSTYSDSKTQIWEVSNEDFQRLCDMDDANWKDEWGWWRHSIGSNMNSPVSNFNINGYEILAWDGDRRLEDEDGNYSSDREYSDLLEYLSEEIGVSQPRNVCALAIDLAKINDIKLSELFSKYQGDN